MCGCVLILHHLFSSLADSGDISWTLGAALVEASKLPDMVHEEDSTGQRRNKGSGELMPSKASSSGPVGFGFGPRILESLTVLILSLCVIAAMVHVVMIAVMRGEGLRDVLAGGVEGGWRLSGPSQFKTSSPLLPLVKANKNQRCFLWRL